MQSSCHDYCLSSGVDTCTPILYCPLTIDNIFQSELPCRRMCLLQGPVTMVSTWHGRYEFQRINHYPTAPRRSKIRARNKNAIPMRTIRPVPILKHCFHRRKMVTWLNNPIDGPGGYLSGFRSERSESNSKVDFSFLSSINGFGSVRLYLGLCAVSLGGIVPVQC